MMTANEARVATIDRLAVMAKEFIINNVGMPIREAINNGRFHATVSFEGVPNPVKTGEEVVDSLRSRATKQNMSTTMGPMVTITTFLLSGVMINEKANHIDLCSEVWRDNRRHY